MVHISCPSIIQTFTPISFPSLSVYPHGVIEAFVFAIPCASVSNISKFYQPNIRSGKVLHHIGILICDSHHNFAAIQGIECEINCLNFCTLWKGVYTDLFSILDYVCI